MSLRLRPYPKMKDSGVPWLGEIPAHWQVLRQRNAVHMLVSNVDKHTKEEEIPVRLCNYVNVYKNERISQNLRFMRATASAEEIDRFRLRLGDVIITKDSEAWDDIGVPALVQYAAADLICGYHLAILRPRDGVVLGAFLLRALQSQGVASQYFVAANGVTRYGLSHDGIKSVFLPIPPLPEQSAIVRFLDHADKRIKRCIAAKRRLIELLNEQKQAIIQKAVTRGLDPDVRLKPSGIEWLPKIPESWGASKLRSCGIIMGGMTPSMENATFWNGEVPWVTPKDMKRFEINDSIDHVTETAVLQTALKKIMPPAVLLVVRGMILARHVPVAISTVSVTINQDMKAILPFENVAPHFLALAMQSLQAPFKPLIDEAGHGTKRFPTERWREVKIPIPPIPEQNAIVNYVRNATVKVQAGITAAESEIALISEFRTRLIADVVTGKLDVRGVELPPLEEAEDLPALADEAIDEPPEGETELEPVEEGADAAD